MDLGPKEKKTPQETEEPRTYHASETHSLRRF